jgi:hypothetical protein
MDVQGQEIVLISKMSKQALRPTQLRIQWILEVLSPGVKWPVGKDYHSPPSSAEIKNQWGHISPPLMFPRGVNRNNFIFYLTMSFHK